MTNKRLKETIQIIIYIFVYALLMHVLNIGCPIKWFTGISCAGCGMTRAFLSLIKGDIKNAFLYHPLFFLMPIIFVLYIFRDKFVDKTKKILLVAFIIIFLVCYIIRLIDPSDMIVSCHINESIIYKLLKGVN